MEGLEETVELTNEQISNISKLISRQRSAEEYIEEAEALLKRKHEELRKIREQDLPTALEAAGCREFTTKDGLKVRIANDMYASIPKSSKHKAAQWLAENDHASIVKNNVVVRFDKGDEEAVQEFVGQLEKLGIENFSVEVDLHTGQVKSAIKEMLDENIDVPLELFGVYFKKEAIIETGA